MSPIEMHCFISYYIFFKVARPIEGCQYWSVKLVETVDTLNQRLY